MSSTIYADTKVLSGTNWNRHRLWPPRAVEVELQPEVGSRKRQLPVTQSARLLFPVSKMRTIAHLWQFVPATCVYRRGRRDDRPERIVSIDANPKPIDGLGAMSGEPAGKRYANNALRMSSSICTCLAGSNRQQSRLVAAMIRVVM